MRHTQLQIAFRTSEGSTRLRQQFMKNGVAACQTLQPNPVQYRAHTVKGLSPAGRLPSLGRLGSGSRSSPAARHKRAEFDTAAENKAAYCWTPAAREEHQNDMDYRPGCTAANLELAQAPCESRCREGSHETGRAEICSPSTGARSC